MTKAELKKALDVAMSRKDLGGISLDVFWRYGMHDFKPVHVTIDAVAALIRYQCITLDGGMDTIEFNALAETGKYKFIVV